MTQLRVGVIGLGMGRHHVHSFGEHEACEVVAIADPDEARLAEIGDEHGIAGRYRQTDDMFANESLDIVAVATPNSMHCPNALQAFEHGCHVLVEKPMALNAAEGRRMLEAAAAADRRLMVNFSYRFRPQSWVLKREVDDGTLGDIYFARTVWLRRMGMPRFGGWFGQKAMSGGGPLIDLGVHRLDFALWLMGYPTPVWVLAKTDGRIGAARAAEEGKAFDVEDFAAAFITFENGASLELEASWAGHIQQREHMETRILGTKAGILDRNTDEGYSFAAEIYLDRNGTQFDLTPKNAAPHPSNPMKHFADCILSGESHTATGEEGLIVMELLDAIYASAERGEPVRVEHAGVRE